MADNISLNPGSGGDTVAADDISSVKYQRVKLAAGGDGAVSNDGVTVYRKVAVGTSADAANIKNAAGVVYSITAVNVDSTDAYLHLYNTSSSPTVGTTTPHLTVPLLATGGATVNLTHGLKFDTGISIGIATTVGGSTGVTADKVVVTIGYV